MKFRTMYNYDPAQECYEHNDMPSETRQSDYEPIDKMVARVIRGEILPPVSDDYFEYDGDISEKDLISDNPLDNPDFDFSDAGSPYQDDIRQGMQDLQYQESQPSLQQVNNAQPQESGANPNSSNEPEAV